MKANILVVDDEPGILRLCQRLLVKAGAKVTVVQNSYDAVSSLQTINFDIVLVDIRMPGLNGFQLIEVARQHQPELAVVLMTGYGTIETAIEALQRGADGLILKPFAGSELVQGVEIALQACMHKRDSLRLRLLRPLFETIKQFFAITEKHELIEQIIFAIKNHLNCYHVMIIDRFADHKVMQVVQKTGLFNCDTSELLLKELVKDEHLSSDLIWINNTSDPIPGYTKFINNLSICSLVCTSASGKDRTRYILAARKSGEELFTETEIEILVVLWAQANAALENVVLYEQLRANLDMLEKSQRTLLQYEKMVTAGRLTASIAHEINNPLQSLSNCLHLIARSGLDEAVRKKYLEAAQTELDRLTETTQRMLELYRPVARQRQPVSIPILIDHVLLLMDKQFQNHGIVLNVEIDERLPQVTAVGSQIQQVLINLILNAIEAMPNGGKIWINADKYLDGLQITVEDSGAGIPDDERDYIFEPFVSTKEHGTGLGLSVSYGILQAHGGNLELVSGNGKGACFRIYLPQGDKL